MMRKIQAALKYKTDSVNGSTMIETLVGFLVVVIMILMFSKVVSVSVSMLNATEKVIDKEQTFNSKVYMKNVSWKAAGMDIYYFIDTEKTDSKNKAKEIKLEYHLVDSGVKYYHDADDTQLKMFRFYVADINNKKD